MHLCFDEYKMNAQAFNIPPYSRKNYIFRQQVKRRLTKTFLSHFLQLTFEK